MLHEPTVQVLVLGLLVDVQDPSFPVASFLLFDCSSLPVDLMLVGPGVHCNTIILHYCLVFSDPILQGSSCLSNVYTQTILAWYSELLLIHHCFIH